MSIWKLDRVGSCLAALILASLLASCAVSPPRIPPVAVQGVIDLRDWNLERDGPVRLDGDWAFYWDASKRTVADASPGFVRVPGTWQIGSRPARGKALYKLRVLTAPGTRLYALKLYEIPRSYRVYVDDERLHENGRYAEDPARSERSLVRPYVVFATSSRAFDLWIEAVGTEDDEPGPRRSIIFGNESDVRQVHEGQVIADMLVTGVLLIMALYHLGLYLQRRREVGSLLFGLLCLIMILRIAVTEEHYLHKYVPQFPSSLEHALDVFSFFVLAPAFTWIFSYFFEQEFHHRFKFVATGIFLVVSTIYFVVLLPLLFNFYLLFTLLVGVYLLFVLTQSIRRRRSGSSIFLAGFLVFVATSVWDILSYSNIVRTIYVSQIGFVCFIFAQAYVLSMRFNAALATSEQLTSNLETVVTERTAALEESNRKLAALNITDALTGIANRRHFDEMLQGEWQRALRNGRPLALGVLDVDHFKKYNDHYGHQAGDVCLQRVAGILADTVHRAGDTVARYGGEEFVVLLPESDGDGAWQFAEKIRLAVEAAALPHAQSPNGIVSVSIGIKSLVPSETDASSQLVRMADDALYEAKRQGRNRAVLAS